jgi:hypothetical protein
MQKQICELRQQVFEFFEVEDVFAGQADFLSCTVTMGSMMRQDGTLRLQ